MVVNKRNIIGGIVVISAIVLVGWYCWKDYVKTNKKYLIKQHMKKYCSTQMKKINNGLNDINNAVESKVNMVKKIIPYLANVYIYLEDINPFFVALSTAYKQLKQFCSTHFNVNIDKYIEDLCSLGIRKLFYHKKEKQIMNSLTYYTNKEKQLEIELSILK